MAIGAVPADRLALSRILALAHCHHRFHHVFLVTQSPRRSAQSGIIRVLLLSLSRLLSLVMTTVDASAPRFTIHNYNYMNTDCPGVHGWTRETA